MNRSAKRGLECREAILASATQLFHDKGYHATTTRDIAHAAGIFVGSIHYHFRSKQKLLYEILSDVVVGASKEFELRHALEIPPLEQVGEILGGHLEYVLKNRVRVSLYLHEIRCLPLKYRRLVERKESNLFERFVSIIRRGQATGVFIAGDARLIGLALVGACNWTYRWYDGKYDVDEVKRIILGSLLRSISQVVPAPKSISSDRVLRSPGAASKSRRSNTASIVISR